MKMNNNQRIRTIVSSMRTIENNFNYLIDEIEELSDDNLIIDELQEIEKQFNKVRRKINNEVKEHGFK